MHFHLLTAGDDKVLKRFRDAHYNTAQLLLYVQSGEQLANAILVGHSYKSLPPEEEDSFGSDFVDEAWNELHFSGAERAKAAAWCQL